MKKNIVRVGFLLSSCFPEEYPGGKNYMKNLLYALSLVNQGDIEIIMFIGKKVADSYKHDFAPFGKVVRTSMLDRKSVHWFLYKVFQKLFGSFYWVCRLTRNHRINIMSHSDIYGEQLSFKTYNWVPDLQFMHLPHLWSPKGLDEENKRFTDRLQSSDVVIFSSYDGQKDGLKLLPDKKDQYIVLRPVYQVDDAVYQSNPERVMQELFNKYDFQGRFFYLPNQFWTHKNHETVFEAVSILKKKGKDALVVCSGLMENADSPERGFADYIAGLRNYIKENDLEKNIISLGFIPYSDVQQLMRNSISVINPSFFEGWSSTVEEAKSIGKSMILSNLNVHMEQEPLGAVFFDPNNPEELAGILSQKWESGSSGPDYDLEREAKRNIKARTEIFGESYQRILLGQEMSF